MVILKMYVNEVFRSDKTKHQVGATLVLSPAL